MRFLSQPFLLYSIEYWGLICHEKQDLVQYWSILVDGWNFAHWKIWQENLLSGIGHKVFALANPIRFTLFG